MLIVFSTKCDWFNLVKFPVSHAAVNCRRTCTTRRTVWHHINHFSCHNGDSDLCRVKSVFLSFYQVLMGTTLV